MRQTGAVEAYVATLVLSLLTAAAGATIGYRIRWREFRREQRLRVYGEAVSAFLKMAHVGSSGLSVFMSSGDFLYTDAVASVREDLYEQFNSSYRAFEDALARLQLVASKDVRAASELMEIFVKGNVFPVPPFSRELDKEAWGDAAKVGPRAIEEEASRLARSFTDTATRDVVPSRER